MKLKILSNDGTEKGSMDMPEQFHEEIRRDIVQRAVIALRSNSRTPYGSFTEAGKRPSTYMSKKRNDYKSTYGAGQSRTPRKIMSRSGSRMSFVGGFAPQTVGGRAAHPPKTTKIWSMKINESENRKAIRSALSATMDPATVSAHGHRLPKNYPFILSDDFNKMSKTADLVKSLGKLGFSEELERASQKKVRAGIGKTRGRKNKMKKGILFVTADTTALLKAARNIPGTDVATIEQLNAGVLAPGARPGRLTLFTEDAVKKLASTRMFTKSYSGKQEAKEPEPKREKPRITKPKAAPKIKKREA